MPIQREPSPVEVEAVRQWAREIRQADPLLYADIRDALHDQMRVTERSICSALWAGVPVPLELVRRWGAYLTALGGDPMAAAVWIEDADV